MIQPIHNKILVRAFKEDEMSFGGIVVPDNYRKEGSKVEIIAVGKGTHKKKMKLSVGEIGFRVKDWGIPIIEDGETHYIMEDSAIIAIV